MKKVRESSEAQVLLSFLQGELCSERFQQKIQGILKEMGLCSRIILEGNPEDEEENRLRKDIMHRFRGYPDKELFENFPVVHRWELVQFEQGDFDKLYYIDYSYWNELSSHTRKPAAAAVNIRKGIEIYGVSNRPFWDGVRYLKEKRFPPVLLISCGNGRYLIIEGHSRMTVYGLAPQYFAGTYGYVGYTSAEQMKRYDKQMGG